MLSPNFLRTRSGKQITLGSELGKGGEGIVYRLPGNSNAAAKIYHSNKAAERREKIEAIVTAQWSKATSCVAFPIDALYATTGQFVGFTMPLVSANKPIHDLYSPTSRKTEFPKATFPFLIRTALNIARALANVHATGCVVGDINHSGILISESAIATLIDCDSFQVRVGNKVFFCKVGVPDFTPPELQGKRLDQIQRTQDHDGFGLAVVLFNLLFMGRHPFAGRYLRRGDMPLETAIAQYRFAYSARQKETQMEPPPNVPLLSDIPSELSDAFELAFGQAGTTRGRPTAAQWAELLRRSESELITCRGSSAHHYFRTASACPWCRMEKGYPGFLAFAPPTAFVASTPVNLGQLIGAIRAVPNPGTAPDLASVMPPYQGTQSPTATSIKAHWMRTYLGALAGTLVSTLMFRLPTPGPLVGLLGIAGSIALALRESKELQSVQQLINQLSSSWKNIEGRWQQGKGAPQFVQRKTEAEETFRSFQNLGAEETKELTNLKVRQRDAQLITFLQKYYIEHAKIKGVADTRKVILRSYGIETAADVSAARIQAISGFGPSITGNIVAWRKSIEGRFVFNPKQPINPSDIAAVKASVGQKGVDLKRKLYSLLKQLEKFSNETIALRNSLRSAAEQVWRAKKQAELDRDNLSRANYSKQVRLVGLVATAVAGFVVQNAVFSIPTPQPPPRIPQDRAPGPPVSATRIDKSERLGDKRGNNEPRQSGAPQVTVGPPARVSRPASATANPGSDTASASGSSQSPAPHSRDEARTTPPQPQLPSPSLRMEVPPLGPPQTIPSLPSVKAEVPLLEPPQTIPSLPNPSLPNYFPSSPPAMGGPLVEPTVTSPLTRENISRIQSRLREAGFLKSYTNGTWDAETRKALQEFKLANRLTRSESWDAQTERALNSPSSVRADEYFVGGWSNLPECDAAIGEPPLLISSLRAQAGGGVCDFESITPNGTGWKVRARCVLGPKKWVANIDLAVNGDRLSWKSERGSPSYFRCR